jgi:hypothetical protein
MLAGLPGAGYGVRRPPYEREILVPEYVELVRRAVAAHDHARALGRESRRIRELAQTLRDAEQGRTSLKRCAWCDRFQVGSEWLPLDAVGHGQQRIRASLLDKASHGICDDCFETEMRRSEQQRRGELPATCT